MNQPMSVLIGYDGSPCAEAALLDLRRAGLPQTVEAVVMCAADVLLPPRHPPAPTPNSRRFRRPCRRWQCGPASPFRRISRLGKRSTNVRIEGLYVD